MSVGALVGVSVGDEVGIDEGFIVRDADGLPVGFTVGLILG